MNASARLSPGLLPKRVQVMEAEPRAIRGGLLPAEEPVVAKAVAKRRLEYTAGRALARQALAAAGFEGAGGFVIAQDERRAPLWPQGFTGSIAHTRDRAVAAASSLDHFRALGLDVERDAPLSEGVARHVLTAEDEAMLERLPAGERGLAGKLVFSAKECAYKCQYTRTRTYLGFDAMWVELDLSARAFVARFRREVGEFAEGAALRGRYAHGDGLVMTAVAYE